MFANFRVPYRLKTLIYIIMDHSLMVSQKTKKEMICKQKTRIHTVLATTKKKIDDVTYAYVVYRENFLSYKVNLSLKTHDINCRWIEPSHR